MMKKKKSIIIIIISILLVIGIAIGLYFILNDKDKLTVSERNWVNESIGTIQNINVVNNVNVFGKDGTLHEILSFDQYIIGISVDMSHGILYGLSYDDCIYAYDIRNI